MGDIAWSSSPNDLWNLVNLKQKELLYIYPDRSWETLRFRRKKFKKQIMEKKVMPPKRTVPYEGIDEEREAAQLRRDTILPRTGPRVGAAALELVDIQERQRLHDLLDAKIDELNIEPGSIGNFRVSVGDHEGYIKNKDNEIEYTRELKRRGITFNVEAKHLEPAWPLVQQAQEQFKIPKYEQRATQSNSETWFVTPDNQIWYWQMEDGETLPFHDVKVHALSLQIMRDLKPDVAIGLGDLIDQPTFSDKYLQHPTFASTGNRAYQFAHNYLAFKRAMAPKTRLIELAGNHDIRADKYVKTNARAAYGLRRTNEDSAWPVLSVPYLTNMESLGVEYYDPYSTGGIGVWATDNLIFTHAPIRKQDYHERVSNVHGHIHKRYFNDETYITRDGAVNRFQASPGTMSDILGRVPSTKGAVDLNGRPAQRSENWQHGFSVVEIDKTTGSIGYSQIRVDTFNDYQTHFNGKTYTPDMDLVHEMEGWDRKR